MTARVVLASCEELPTGDGDEARLVEELARHGIHAVWVPWGGPVDPDELVVLRATWDYTDRIDEFLRWCASLPKLVNPYKVVRHNVDKRYLVELAKAGLPVIPTVVHEIGTELEQVGDDFVVKPVIGAGSRGAGRFTTSTIEMARRHLRQLHEQGRAAVVQPYQRAVDVDGETALVFFRGKYSHAFHKGPMLPVGILDTGAELYAPEQLGTVRPDAEMIDVARECLVAAAEHAEVAVEELVYARVDLVRGEECPLLLEMELAEPSLGFRYADSAAITRFAAEIASACE